MCGIAGFVLHPDEKVNSRRLAQELLLGIEHRGTDATGAAWRSPHKGDTLIQKRDVPASEFVGQLSTPRKATSALLHTRLGTQGSEVDPNNNHPIRVANIVGVHNGMVSNDDELFADMRMRNARKGQVDSEAIFAALAYGRIVDADTGEPFLQGCHTITDVLSKIEGSAAIGWYDDNPSTSGDALRVARLSFSPLYIAQTPQGSFLFASEEGAVARATAAVGLAVGWDHHLDEGTLVTVSNDGSIVGYEEFTPAPSRWARYASTYAYSSYDNTQHKRNTTDVTSVSSVSARTGDVTYEGFPEPCDIDANLLRSNGNLYPVPMSEEEHRFVYAERDIEVELFLQACAEEGDNEYEVRKMLVDMLANAREGDWVSTKLGGIQRSGDIVAMPDDPYGDYVVRVRTANSDTKDGWESVLVLRKASQLTVLNRSTVPDGASRPTERTDDLMELFRYFVRLYDQERDRGDGDTITDALLPALSQYALDF